jgi:hypothetical protein
MFTLLERQEIIGKLSHAVYGWSVNAVIEFVNEQLQLDFEEGLSDSPTGNIYSWSITELLDYAQIRYANELESCSDNTLLELLG